MRECSHEPNYYGKTDLDLPCQGNDVVLVQLDNAVDIDLARVAIWLAVRRKALGIHGRLLAQPLQQRTLDRRLRDQRLEGLAVRLEDVGDERRGVVDELGLGDKFACSEAGRSESRPT